MENKEGLTIWGHLQKEVFSTLDLTTIVISYPRENLFIMLNFYTI